jgi:hypothetical protein
MISKKFVTSFIAYCAIVATTSGYGAVADGGFETGLLLPNYQGYINNPGNFAAHISAVVPFLDVPGSSLLALGQGSPTTGSAISQDLTVSAGDILTFDWNFLTDEHNEGIAYNDFAIFTIGNTPFFLVSRNSSFSTLNLVSPPAGFDGQTNWATQNYTFPSSGTFKLAFAVFNVGDAGHDSVLLVDGLTVTSVPEPGATAILIIGVAGMFFMKRRKKIAA